MSESIIEMSESIIEIKNNLKKIMDSKEFTNNLSGMIAKFFEINFAIAYNVIDLYEAGNIDGAVNLIFEQKNELKWSYNHVFFIAKTIYAATWDIIYDRLEFYHERKINQPDFEDIYSMMGMSLSIIFAQITRDGIGEGDIRALEFKDKSFEDYIKDYVSEENLVDIKKADSIINEFSKIFADMVFDENANQDTIYDNHEVISSPEWLVN